MSPNRAAPWLALAVAAQAGAADEVPFDSQVVPILEKRCVMCHVEGAELGGLKLYPDAWTQLVGVTSTQSPLKLVEPGSPDRSYLYAKLMGTQVTAGGSGLRMPAQPLGAEELETIRRWIAEGAKRD